MGKTAGKCCFEDTVEIQGIERMLNSDIYIGDEILPLKIESMSDLIPYYPYLTWIQAWDNTKGKGFIRLAKESFVDKEERERLEWYQQDAVKYINRCKRKKEPVDFEYFNNDRFVTYKDIQTEILKRVAEKNMSLDGIHLPMHEHYRKNLYDEMIKNGWDEYKSKMWCFGYREEYPV